MPTIAAWTAEPPTLQVSPRLSLLIPLPIAFFCCCGSCGTLRRLPAFATFAANIGHVRAIAAHGFATLLSGAARFFGIEFVRRAFLVCCLSAFARDFTLLVLVHRRETALGRLPALLGTAGTRAFAAVLFAGRHVDLLVPVGCQW